MLCDRVLYLRHFFGEVLNKYLLEPAGELHWLLADQFEAPIDRAQVLFRDPGPRFQCFFNVWILGCLADLLIELGRPLRALPCVTKQRHKKFLWGFYWHNLSPFRRA